MQFTLATIALAAASLASAQGVAQVIKPSGSPPAGCSTDYSGKFEITVVLPNKKRDIVEVRLIYTQLTLSLVSIRRLTHQAA